MTEPCFQRQFWAASIFPIRPARLASSLAIAVVSLVFLVAYGEQPIPGVESPPPTLDGLIGKYLQTDDPKDRQRLIPTIEHSANGSIQSVVSALRQVRLWPPFEEKDRILIPTASAGEVHAICRLPVGVNGEPKWPMFLCLPVRNEPAAIKRAVELVPPAISEGFFIVTLDKLVGGELQQPPVAAQDFRKIVRELRRKLPLDTERLFLIGAHEGGEAAWNTALFQPDLFAGVITVSAAPRLPFAQQLLPLLADNLRHTPVFSIFQRDDDPLDDLRKATFGAYSAFLTDLASRRSVPIRVEQVAHLDRAVGSVPDSGAIAETLRTFISSRRVAPGQPTAHWFRYPSQGDAGWLRAVKTYGDVWTEDQLSIVSNPTTDRDAFVTETLKDKLFYIAGRADGQTITIETRRIAEIELRLYDGMMDFARPITVIINGRKRHETPVKPSIATMLESAFETWEFQRLVVAKLSFSIRADAPESRN